jgi:hypothetical protein
MHSLEGELDELIAAGDANAAPAAALRRGQSRDSFSVAVELRIGLYGSVALIIGGIGILVRRHLEHIGPLALVIVLAVLAAGCYLPALRARRRGARPSGAADYLLLLGALIVSADLGYAELQFRWFGQDWSLHLLLLAAVHAAAAYYFQSRLVLSVALTALAAWFGIQRKPGTLVEWDLHTPELGARALACAAVILGWRLADARLNAGRFVAVLEHFAINLAFWGVLCWCWDGRLRVPGLLGLCVLTAIAVRGGLREGKEAFLVYGVGYAALALGGVVIERNADVPGAFMILVIVLSAAALLRYLHDRLRRASR